MLLLFHPIQRSVKFYISTWEPPPGMENLAFDDDTMDSKEENSSLMQHVTISDRLISYVSPVQIHNEHLAGPELTADIVDCVLTSSIVGLIGLVACQNGYFFNCQIWDPSVSQYQSPWGQYQDMGMIIRFCGAFFHIKLEDELSKIEEVSFLNEYGEGSSNPSDDRKDLSFDSGVRPSGEARMMASVPT
ncbi:hypothetical protein Tco_0026152 [Tanacetum coccineum]